MPAVSYVTLNAVKGLVSRPVAFSHVARTRSFDSALHSIPEREREGQDRLFGLLMTQRPMSPWT